jgi:hypothetical protein
MDALGSSEFGSPPWQSVPLMYAVPEFQRRCLEVARQLGMAIQAGILCLHGNCGQHKQ